MVALADKHHFFGNRCKVAQGGRDKDAALAVKLKFFRVADDQAIPPARTFAPTRWLHDGDRVTVGAGELEVVHCPGHTPGHVVFVSRAERFALVGDVLFAGSIGRTDFPRGNHAQLIDSIRGKLFPLGDDITFIPGHGAPSTFGQERETNPFVADRITGYGGTATTGPDSARQNATNRYQ